MTYRYIPTYSRNWGINRCKTQETEGGGDEAEIEANANNNVEAKMDMDESMADGHVKTFPTLILEISAVASENQWETEEMGGGGKKGKTGTRSKWNMIRHEQKSNQTEADSAKRWVERKSNTAEVDSAERRSVEPNPGKSRSNRESIGRDRSGQKLLFWSRTWTLYLYVISLKPYHYTKTKINKV